jgi:hypothetical protein
MTTVQTSRRSPQSGADRARWSARHPSASSHRGQATDHACLSVPPSCPEFLVRIQRGLQLDDHFAAGFPWRQSPEPYLTLKSFAGVLSYLIGATAAWFSQEDRETGRQQRTRVALKP